MREFFGVGLWSFVFLLSAALSSADEPTRYPNPQKYAERRPAATGRSGSARVATRGLIDRQNHTVLEITTGTLDLDEPAAGRIVKAQIKGLTASGDAAFTRNYNGLDDGLITLESDDYRRGQPLQIQTHVRGIDGARTDVVAVTETVRRRPDLAVGRLESPAKAVQGLPINLSAAVSELNGDAGARTDCVLYVDEVEVDRADAIWVDAGDEVTCAFTHAFDSAGSHTVKVAASPVTPGDWDESNNFAAAPIVIDERFARVEATFRDEESSSTQVSRGWYAGPSSGADYESRSSRTGWTQWGLYRAYVFDTAVAFPVYASATISDGASASTTAFTIAADYTTGNPDGWCRTGQRQAYTGGRSVVISAAVCNIRGRMWSLVDYQRNSGVVTYSSSGVNRSWWRSGGTILTSESSWSYNSPPGGSAERLQAQRITYDVSLTAVGVTYRWPVDIEMSPFAEQWNDPEVCDDWGSGADCWSSQGYRRGSSGSVVLGLPDPRAQD
jgi:hypothetical protein